MLRHAGRACALAALLIAPALADEVRLTNGDRLTGTVVDVRDGALSFKSEALGDMKIPMDAVASFATDDPVELHLADGTVVTEPVAASETDGEIRANDDTVPLGDVAAVNPHYGTWSGSVSAGALVTRGNSDTESFNAAIETVRRGKNDRLSLGGSYLYSRQENDDGEDETTADAWRVKGQYDYFLTQRLYPYGRILVEQDRPADVLLRVIPGAGFGYEWYQGPAYFLNTEGGLAWLYEKLDCENDPPGSNSCSDDTISQDSISARLAYHTHWIPRDGLTLFHNLEYFPSLEDAGDFFFNADAGLRVSLFAGLFSELKAEWRHDQTPAPDADRNDFRYVLNLGWAFQ